jgi:DNA polymerase (family X)
MTLAERIQSELQPFCIKCEIAGSIRRGRPEVGDIDQVILPRGANAVQPIKDRCKQRCRVTTDGKQNFICMMKVKTARGDARPTSEEFQLDIFFAHNGIDDLLNPQPTNYGSLLLCRTGSKEHNIWLATKAKAMDMHWSPYQGLFAGGAWRLATESTVLSPESTVKTEYVGGELIASETEEQIYDALGLKWISPALREVRNGQIVHSPESSVHSHGTAGETPGSTLTAVHSHGTAGETPGSTLTAVHGATS